MSETEINTDGAAPEAPDSSKPAWPSPGQKLKKIREELGLSHARVADALHMTAHYVKALENDQYEKLPGRTFVKGYFRSYARLLGADVNDIMQCYQKYMDAIEESESSEADDIRAQKAYDQNVRWLVTAAVIIIVVVGVSWWFAGRHDSAAAISANADEAVADAVENPAQEQQGGATADTASSPPDAAESATVRDLADGSTESPEPAVYPVSGEEGREDGPREDDVNDAIAGEPGTGDGAVAAATATGQDDTPRLTLPDYTVTNIDDHRLVELDTEGNDTLAVHFSGASWIEIDNADNTRLYHDMLHEGDDLNIRGKAPFNILIGDANMVDVTFNSQQVEITRIRTDNSARILLEPEAR